MKSVSIGAAWKEAQLFMQREAGLLIPVALLFIGVPLALMLQVIPPELRQVQMDPAAPKAEVPFYPVFVIFGCSVLMIGGMLTIYALALKGGISLKEALVLGFRRIGVSLGASLIIGCAIFVPLAMAGAISPQIAATLTLLAIALATARMLMLNAIVVDRRVGVMEALRTSWVMSKGQWMKFLLFLAMVLIPVLLAQMVCETLLGLVGIAIGGPDMGWRLGALGGALVMAMGQMVMVVMTARIYQQLAD